MQITATLTEILDAARGSGALPAAVTEVTATPGAVTAQVAVHELPGVSPGVRMAARLAGPVTLHLTTELSGTTLTVVVRATARGMNLSDQVVPVLRDAVTRLPHGLATVRAEADRSLVEVDLDEVARRWWIRVEQVELGQTVRVTGAVVPQL